MRHSGISIARRDGGARDMVQLTSHKPRESDVFDNYSLDLSEVQCPAIASIRLDLGKYGGPC